MSCRAWWSSWAPTREASCRCQTALPLRWQCGLGGRVDAYSLRDDEAALRYALAAGANSASIVDDPAKLEFDLALVGQGGCGAWGDLLPAILAQERGAAMVLDVLDASCIGDALRVVRDLGRGSSEVLRVSRPAVLAISGESPRRLYVSRHRRQQAAATRKNPKVWTDPLAATAGPWEPVRPRVKTGGLSAKTGGTAVERMNALVGATETTAAGGDRPVITADAVTCGQHLLRYLAHHGFIDKAIEPSVDPPSPGPLAAEAVTMADAQGRAASRAFVNPSSSRKASRGPRLLDGQARGMARRPRLVAECLPSPRFLGKLTRRPRPLGQAISGRIRGPFCFGGPSVG